VDHKPAGPASLRFFVRHTGLRPPQICQIRACTPQDLRGTKELPWRQLLAPLLSLSHCPGVNTINAHTVLGSAPTSGQPETGWRALGRLSKAPDPLWTPQPMVPAHPKQALLRPLARHIQAGGMGGQERNQKADSAGKSSLSLSTKRADDLPDRNKEQK
jgi:hypothetical protein